MIARRDFLIAAVSLFATNPFKMTFASQEKERTLNMFNIHTNENINVIFYESGRYKTDSLKEIYNFFRCHYTNEVKAIDIDVLNLLCGIKDIVGKDKEIHIISGYRSLSYNEHLIKLGRRVSRNSLHLHGLAIDFAIPGVSNHEIFNTAKSFKAGGVGVYSDFVHIDTGRIRHW